MLLLLFSITTTHASYLGVIHVDQVALHRVRRRVRLHPVV